MRIGLITEGTYPVVTGGVSTWCHRLITQLPEHDFHLISLVGRERKNVWPVLDNIRSFTVIPMWDRIPNKVADSKQRKEAAEALHDLWKAVLPTMAGGPDLDLLRSALLRLSSSGPVPLSAVLGRQGSTRAILSAWKAHAKTHRRCPDVNVGVAADVARQVDRMLGVLDVSWPDVDLVNTTSNGAAAMMAVVRQASRGTPQVMSEHGVYLRERYLALGAAKWPWSTRYLFLAFLKGVCQLAYKDAAALAPVSEFNARWEVALGADPERIAPIFNGIDPSEFPEVTTEPEVPTITFVGRIDPLKDLGTLIDAFSWVRQAVPNAVLKMFGPTPEVNADYRRVLENQIAELGFEDAITFEGPTNGPQPAILAGSVVALSSISEGLPFSVIESMMSGRATVNTDVGGVSEVVGRDGNCGILVPSRDPKALGEALASLLIDDSTRKKMGRAARQRALELFTVGKFEQKYRALYQGAVADKVHSLDMARMEAGKH